MALKNILTALNQNIPVLFANIGWADRYDGTESIKGRFSWIRSHPRNNSEAKAFRKDEDGLFYCGIGRGEIPYPRFHVVLVAVDPIDNRKKIVGVYASAQTYLKGTWVFAKTRHAVRIPVGTRPVLQTWPGHQGIRRWAYRSQNDGPSYPSLLRRFVTLKSELTERTKTGTQPLMEDQTYSESAREGEPQRYLVTHRKREAKLRAAKIQAALDANRGRLVCEVPGYGFDFVKRYGEIGRGYAQVHHRLPLSNSDKHGQKTRLEDLAIVCANCHAMLHYRQGDKCRKLTSLMEKPGRRGAKNKQR